MTLSLIKQVVGPIGRWLMDDYTAHSVLLSIVLAGWMVVVGAGQHGVNRLRWQVRTWVRQLASAGTPSPEAMLELLDSRWQEASRGIRWMPAAKGFWTRSAQDGRLRELAGFTLVGVNHLIEGLAETSEKRSRWASRPSAPRVIGRAAGGASGPPSEPRRA